MCVFLIAKELDGFVHCHVEHIVDVLSSISHVQYIVLEAFAVAGFAGKSEVCHKLHLDGDISGTLAFLASSAFGIKGEILCCKAHLFSQRLGGEECADGIVGFQISGRIAACTLAYRVLVDKLDVSDALPVAFQ